MFVTARDCDMTRCYVFLCHISLCLEISKKRHDELLIQLVRPWRDECAHSSVMDSCMPSTVLTNVKVCSRGGPLGCDAIGYSPFFISHNSSSPLLMAQTASRFFSASGESDGPFSLQPVCTVSLFYLTPIVCNFHSLLSRTCGLSAELVTVL